MATVLKEEGTLRNQEEFLKTENRVLHYAVYGELSVGALLGLYGIFSFLSSGSFSFLILGALVIFLGLAHHMKRDENRDEASKISSGRSGEEFVSDLFEDELPDDFYLINDVDVSAGSRTAQNDHIVVAPGGIFLVETKTYAGRLTGTADAEHWTQHKGDETNKVTNPVVQSAYHREVLSDFLRAENLPIRTEDLHEFVAMVNKECEWNVEGTETTVDYAWSIPEEITRIGEEVRYDDQTLNDFLTSLGVEPPDEDPGEASEPSGEKSVFSGTSKSTPVSEETVTDDQSKKDQSPGESSRDQEFSEDPEQTMHSEETETEWWVYRNGSVSDRTYTTQQLQELGLNPETKICRAGEETWTPLRETEVFSQ